MVDLALRPAPALGGRRLLVLARALRWPANMAGVVVIAAVWIYLNLVPFWGDAHGYWYSVQPGVEWYGRQWNVEADAFVYSPPLGLVFSALGWMTWPAFYALWTALLLVVAAWMLTPALAAVLLIPELPLRADVMTGNVTLLIAASVVLALRGRSWAWAFPLLTKVTPGVGILWHAARGEWRALRTVLAVTALVVLGSVLIVPGAWWDWCGVLARGGPPLPGTWIEIPLPVRLAVAAVIVVHAARTDRAWVVPIAVWIATPNWAVWQATTVLAASVALMRSRVARHRNEDLSHRHEVVVDQPIPLGLR